MSDKLNESRARTVGIYLDAQSKYALAPQKSIDDYGRDAENALASVSETINKRQQRQLAELDAANAAYMAGNTPTPKPEKVELKGVQSQLGTSDLVYDNDAASKLQRENRTGGELLADIGLSIVQGGKRAYSTLVNAATLSALGLRNVEEAFGGRDSVTIQEALNQADEMTRVDALNNWIASKKSEVTNNKAAKLEAIRNDPNLSESERTAAGWAFYKANPDMAGMAIVESAIGSYLELVGIGKFATAGGASIGTATNIGLFGSGASGYLEQAKQGGEVTGNTLVNSIFAGLGTTALNKAAHKIVGGNNIDELAIRGLTTGKGGATQLLRAGVQEMGEEVPQNVGSAALYKYEKNKPLNQEIGLNALEGGLLGFGSGIGMAAPSAIAKGSQGAVESINTKLKEADTKKFGNTEENLDPTNKKHDPTRAYKKALYDINSSDPLVRAEAEITLAASSQVAFNELDKFDSKIAATTDEATKKSLLADKAKYEAEHVSPLKAEISNYINQTVQNKDNFLRVMEDYAQAQSLVGTSRGFTTLAEYEQEARENLDKEITNYSNKINAADYAGNYVEGSADSSSTPSASSNGLAAIIQKGESGGAGHKAVNYGSGKAKGNLDPTRMTLGDIADGLKNGSFVAIGKYQFNKSSFPDIFKNGNVKGIDRNTVFTPEVQDKIFAEYYVGKKRENLGKYIRGENVTVQQANDALADEWQAAKGANGKGRLGKGATIDPATIQSGLQQSRAIYAQMIKDGKSPEAAMKAAVLFSLGGESTGATVARDPRIPQLGDGDVDNAALSGLKLKGGEGGQAVQGGKTKGYTAEFAFAAQHLLGKGLKYFSAVNDNYHTGTSSKHASGNALDIVLSDGSKANSIKVVEQLKAEAAAKGYTIKVLNEYTDPSANATGGHIHVSVTGRTTAQGGGGNSTGGNNPYTNTRVGRTITDTDEYTDSLNNNVLRDSQGTEEEDEVNAVESEAKTDSEGKVISDDGLIDVEEQQAIVDKATEELEVLNTTEGNLPEGTKAQVIQMLENKITAANKAIEESNAQALNTNASDKVSRKNLENKLSAAQDALRVNNEGTSNFPDGVRENVTAMLENKVNTATEELELFDSQNVPAIKPSTPEESEFINQAKRQTRAFFSSTADNTLTDEQIDSLPMFDSSQKESLKQLSAFKRDLANKQTVDSVTDQIINGYQGSTAAESNLGLVQYDKLISLALASGDVDTLNKHLGNLERFANNHKSKDKAIQLALNPVPQQVTNADGTTEMVTNPRPSNVNPAYLVAEVGGEWVETTKERFDLAKANNGSTFAVTGDNKGTRRISREEQLISGALKHYTDGSRALLGDAVKPMRQSTDGAKASSKARIVPAPADAAPGTKSTSSSKPKTKKTEGAKSKQSKPVESVKGYAAVKPRQEDRVPEEGIWLGRSGTGKETRSMGNVKTNDDVGKRGWLGQNHNKGSVEERLENYIADFVSKALNFEVFPDFVPALIAMKGKDLYASSMSSNKSEVAFIAELLEILPTDLQEAYDLIARIEGYTVEGGIKLGKEVEVELPEEPNAPVRTRHDVDATKNRSAIESSKTKTTTKGKARQGLTTKNSRNEISTNTLEETDSYSNMYSGLDANGVATSFTIKREKGTNNIISVVRDIEGRPVGKDITPSDKTYSDELLMSKYEALMKVETEFVQDNLNDMQEDRVEDYNGHVIPKEMQDKPVLLTEVLELYSNDLEPDALDINARELLVAIIKPILGFNPTLKVEIAKSSESNSYNDESNTIEISVPMTEGTILQEIARLVISSATSKVADELELLGSTAMVVDLNRLYELNQDLSEFRRHIDTIIRANDSRYTSQSDDTKIKILNAMKSNANLLEMATTDMDIVAFLRNIKIENRKVSNSVFKRVVDSLKSFLNIGSSYKVNTRFDDLLDITIRAVSEQARNNAVDFKASEDARLHLFANKDDVSLNIAQKLEVKKSFFNRNQMLAGFTQKVVKGKPLTRIANLTAKMKLDLMQGLQELTSKAPTKAQREQVEDFLVFRDEYVKHLKDTFAQVRPVYLRNEDKSIKMDADGKPMTDGRDFGFRDLKTYLMDENGDINENILTSMAIGAYDYIIENGNKLQNLDKDIKRILNLEPDDSPYIRPEVREFYQYRGAIKPFVSAKVGKKSAEAMGIKANANMSIDSQSRFENSLGEWNLSAMQSADLIHIHRIDSKVHRDNIAEVEGDLENFDTVNENGKVSFISITNVEGTDVNPRLYEVFKKNKGTVGYLGEVFGVEMGLRAPLKKAPNKVIDKIKRTISTMSINQRQYVEKMQAEPISINVDMFNTLKSLIEIDRDAALQMLGAMITKEDLAKEHKNNRHSKESAAEGVYRDLENGLDFIESLDKIDENTLAEFYDYVYAAKNNRMHYGSNMFNFQSSKLHRSLGEYTNFRNEIDISEVTENGLNILNEEGQISGAAFFLRAVGESAEGTEDIVKAALSNSGIKEGFTVDKLDSINFIDPFYNYLRTDVDVQSSVKSLTKLAEGKKITKEEAATIAKVVKFWEGEANSLRALIEYAKFQNAVDNKTSFTTSLGLGSDGINNGSAISYTQLGVGTDKFYTQVGILFEDGEYGGINNYFQTRTDSSIGDYYTGFAVPIDNAIADSKDSENVTKILKLNTSFFIRKSFKAVLIPFGYSASIPRLKELVFGQFMQDVTSSLTEIGNMDTSNPVSKAEADFARMTLQDNLNSILKEPIVLPEGKELLEFWFTNQQHNELKKLYIKEMGGVVSTALKDYAGEFMVQRDRNVDMQKAAYDVYEKIKTNIVEAENAKYKEYLKTQPQYKDFDDKGIEAVFKNEGIPREYYDKHHKSKLDAIRPSVKTPFNKDSTDWFDESNFSIPQENTTLKADDASQSTTWKVDDKQNLVGSTVKAPKAEKGEISSGVMVNSAQVQATDAIIAAVVSAFGGNVNINVHDAAISGLLNYIAMGQQQNKSTYEALRDYHAQTFSLLAFSEMMNSAVIAHKEGIITQENLRDLMLNSLETMLGEDAIKDFMDEKKLFGTLTNDLMLKQVIMPMLDSVILDAKKTELRKLKKLKRVSVMHQYGGEGAEYTVTAEDKAKIDDQFVELGKIYREIQTNFNGLKAINTTVDVVDNKDVVETSDDNLTLESDVIELVPTTLAELRTQMSEMISNEDGMTEQRRVLYNFVMERIRELSLSSERHIKVEYSDKLAEGNRGYFDVKRGVIVLNQNYLLKASPDGRIELVLHEAIHAITVVTIATSNDPKVKAAIAQLEAMRVELLAAAKGNKYLTDTVFESVEEFIAYGMTDAMVQQFMLDNLKGTYTAPEGKARKGLMKFLNAAYTMLTGKKTVSKADKNFETFARMVDMVAQPFSAEDLAEYNGRNILNSTANITATDTLKQLTATNVSTEHNEHLDGVIETVITDFLEVNDTNINFVNSTITNVSNRSVNAGYKMSDKELHVMEILKEVARTFLTENSGTKTASEVRLAHAHAVNNMTVEHFLDDPANATPVERKAAQKKYDYVFKQDNINKKEQQERFFSLMIASEEFRGYAAKIDNKKTTKDETTGFNKLMEMFANMMRWASGRVLNTSGLNLPNEMTVLFKRLNEINKSARANHVNMLDKTYAFTTSLVTVPANFIISKVLDGIFGVFNFGAASSNPTIRNISSAMSKARSLEIGDIASTYLNLGTSATRIDASGRQNGFGELIFEMGRTKGMKQVTEFLIRMTNKAGQDRQTASTKAKEALGKSFKNLQEVPKSQLDAITQVGLRTDASSLMRNGTSITKVLKLLTSPSDRQIEIDKLEAKISSNPNANDILIQTKALGRYMATEVAPEHLVKNAEGIAIGKDSWYESDPKTMDIGLRNSIDQLATLYAINDTTTAQQAELTALINKDPDAVKAVLNHHLEMVNQSMKDFKDNMPNYSKGYMPQKTHNLRSLKFAETADEITKLESQGWERISDNDLTQDKSDTSDARTLMFHKDMLYQDYVSGALDMKDTHAKGTMVYNVNGSGQEVRRVQAEKLADRRKRNQTNHKNYNFAKQKEGNLIASYNAAGELTGYHYEMAGRLRDTYLERDSNALELMGMYHSNLVFKPQIAVVQQTVAQELHKDFVKSYANDPRLFVTLDPESKDPNVVAMWRMMPYEFRAEATKLFGKGNPIVVRSTIYNTVFGYRTYSMAEMFDKVNGEKNGLERFLTTLLNVMTSGKGQMRILQAERMWQKGVAQMKDFIVIRNYKILVGNIVANSLLLSLQGVSPTQQVKDFISVWSNGGKYRKQAARVIEIDTQIAINRNRPKELSRLKRERNITNLEMERNPLHEFMEQGLMSSIVEDTTLYSEDTGFKSDLDKKMDELAAYLPEQVTTAFNWAIMSPGTPLHNFMAHSTQFSDLAAKYSLTKHRMKKGDSQTEAIAQAQDAFINYDVPTGRGLDYLNKMGLFMFTKFILRFQQALMKQLSERAGSAISQHMMIEQLTNQSGVLEPFILNRIGNPFSAGLFGYSDAFGSISTVNFMNGMFD